MQVNDVGDAARIRIIAADISYFRENKIESLSHFQKDIFVIFSSVSSLSAKCVRSFVFFRHRDICLQFS